MALASTAWCLLRSNHGEGEPREWGEWQGQVPGGWEWPGGQEGVPGHLRGQAELLSQVSSSTTRLGGFQS